MLTVHHHWCGRLFTLCAVASPGFAAMRGRDGNYVMGRSRRTSGQAGCNSGLMTNSFVTNTVLIERAVSC